MKVMIFYRRSWDQARVETKTRVQQQTSIDLKLC